MFFFSHSFHTYVSSFQSPRAEQSRTRWPVTHRCESQLIATSIQIFTFSYQPTDISGYLIYSPQWCFVRPPLQSVFFFFLAWFRGFFCLLFGVTCWWPYFHKMNYDKDTLICEHESEQNPCEILYKLIHLSKSFFLLNLQSHPYFSATSWQNALS